MTKAGMTLDGMKVGKIVSDAVRRPSIAIHAPDVMRQVDLKIAITGMREHRVRMWVTKQILKLVSWVIAGKCTVTVVIKSP